MADASMGPSYFHDTTPYMLFCLFSATIGPLLFGYHLAELNEPQDVLTCAKRSLFDRSLSSPSLPQCIPMTPAEIGLVSSIFTVGGLCGALAGGTLASRYGRVNSMRLLTVTFTIGGLAEAAASNIAIISLGRFVSGIGAGASLVVAPLYISEIAPPSGRGFFGAFTQVMINVGILVTQLLGFFLSEGQLWRIILGVGGVIGLGQLAALSLAIESPRRTSDHGLVERAAADLQRLRRKDYDVHGEMNAWKLDEAEESQTLLHDEDTTAPRPAPAPAKKESLGMLAVLLHPSYRRAVVAVMVVMVAQQFTGINSIVMYGVKLLSTVLTTSSASINLLISAINIAVTVLCAPLVDRLGRRPCLLTSIGGMGVSALLLGIAIRTHVPVFAAVTVMTFVGSFGIGLGAVPFILASELVDTEASAATQGWALAANWSSTFVVAQFFPMINEAMGPGNVYFLFTALAAGFATFVFFFVPETKGKLDANEVWGRDVERRLD